MYFFVRIVRRVVERVKVDHRSNRINEMKENENSGLLGARPPVHEG